MHKLPDFIPATVQEAFISAIHKAVEDVKPYLPNVQLTDDERRSLNPRTMGPESVGFVTDAGQLMKSFPNVLPRSITDTTMTEFPARLQQFQDYSVMLNEVMAVLRPVLDGRLLVGVHLRDTSREVHAAGRRDTGKTPGVKDLVAKLDAYLEHAAKPVKPSKPAADELAG